VPGNGLGPRSRSTRPLSLPSGERYFLARHDSYDQQRDLLDPGSEGRYLREIESSVSFGKDEDSEGELGDLVATAESD